MQLTKLIVTNFRGVKDKEFDLKDTNIFVGSNGEGKTTCLDAVNFILTGETFVNGKDNGENINSHNKREVSEVSLEVEYDFSGVSLKKTYGKKVYESWRKSRETGEEVFDKVAVDYFINGTKFTKAEYDNDIITTFGIKFDKDTTTKSINIVRLLTDLDYLDSLEPKVERAFLNKVCKVPSDIQLLQNDKFKNYREVVLNFNGDLDKAKKHIDNRLTQEQGKLALVNEKIDNDKKNLNEIEFDESKFKEQKQVVEGLKTDIADMYREIKDVDVEVQKSKKEDLENLLKSNKELSDLKSKSIELSNKINEKNEELNSLSNENVKLYNGTVYPANRELSQNETKLNSLKSELEQAKSENKQFVCFECGATNILKDNSNKVETLKEEIKNTTNTINKCKATLEKANEQMATLGNKANIVISHLEALKSDKKSVDELISQKESTNTNEVKESEKTLNLIKTYNEKVALYEAKYEKFTKENSTLEEMSNTRTAYINLENSLEDNENDKRSIAGTVAELEDQKDEAKEFDLYKNKTIQKISKDIFGDIEFVLVENKSSGEGEKAKCYAKINDVKFGGVNTANKQLTSIKILNSIRKQIGGEGLPYVFDIVDNIGKKVLGEIQENAKAQIFCTRANQEEGVKLGIAHE